MKLFDKTKPSKASLIRDSGEAILLEASYLIGRSVQCDLILTDSKISRTHISIIPDKLGNWWLMDLGSTNGTFINYKKISQPYILKNLDRIGIGDEQFSVLIEKDDTAEKIINPPILESEEKISSEPYYFLSIQVSGCYRIAKEYEEEEEITKIIKVWQKGLEKIINKSRGEIAMISRTGLMAVWEEKDIKAADLFEVIQEIQKDNVTAEFQYRISVHQGRMKIGENADNGYERLIGEDIQFCYQMSQSLLDFGNRVFYSSSVAKSLTGYHLKLFGELPLLGIQGSHQFFISTNEFNWDKENTAD
jgi:pSer/pThr/pTyr-binding forkhead associated (FHA) protein